MHQIESYTISTVELHYEQDVVLARQRARQIAELLGLHRREHTRVATAVSEIARNAFEYGGGGRVRFLVDGSGPPLFTIVVEDHGRGIEDLAAILEGRYKSPTGMGVGITGARQIMDQFTIESAPGKGTVVRMSRELPDGPLTRADIVQIRRALDGASPESPYEEVQKQNQELLHSLEEIGRLNRELEATNRGVVALYAELDEHADYLRRANELKTSFLSNMSHEFRTPLNAVESISLLLLERADGPLSSEQEKQVVLIRGAAAGLLDLVNELLDLAKAEAGKLSIHLEEFSVETLFDSLKGMLRPLLAHNSSVDLIFECPDGLPKMRTDDRKVAQILRNFISNALKFTEEGEVRVGCEAGPGDTIVFTVRDTGVGIGPLDQERVFEEFVQIDGAHQKRLKGTGLGLALCRKLAEFLGGCVSLQSQLGVGSTFQLWIPRNYSEDGPRAIAPGYTAPGPVGGKIENGRVPVLVVEDNREMLFLYEKFLEKSAFQMIQAHRIRDARSAVAQYRPAVILLDVLLQDEHTWGYLEELKSDPATSAIPIVVITIVDNERKAMSMGADVFGTKPVDRAWLIDVLERLAAERLAVPPLETGNHDTDTAVRAEQGRGLRDE